MQNAWEVGAYVSQRLAAEAWGSKTVTELAEYLRTRDPSLRGYSRRNIYNMVALYDSYGSASFLEIAERYSLESHQNEIMQSATAQIDSAEIVQFPTAQMPSFLIVLKVRFFGQHLCDD